MPQNRQFKNIFRIKVLKNVCIFNNSASIYSVARRLTFPDTSWPLPRGSSLFKEANLGARGHTLAVDSAVDFSRIRINKKVK